MGFSHSSVGKESACNAGDPGLILAWEHSLEKEMATHSSILAWRNPWAEEPGRLQSLGSKRVGHNLTTKPPNINSQLLILCLKHLYS